MISDSEFVAFINHAIQLALDLTTVGNTRCQYVIYTGDALLLQSMLQHQDRRIYGSSRKIAEQSKNNIIIILLMEFQLMYSLQCVIHQCCQKINMMAMPRITHNYCIMLILMTY